MNWDALTAVSTAFTGAVIAVTAIAAIREVRLAAEYASASRDQIAQLRKATEFEGLLAVFNELDSPAQFEARRFVMFDLAERLKDPDFRREVSLLGLVDERKHPELIVLRCFERIAYYAEKGFVEPDVLHMVASGRILTMWAALQDVVALQRESAGNVWFNFERLYNETREWLADHGLNTDHLHRMQLEEIERIRETSTDPR